MIKINLKKVKKFISKQLDKLLKIFKKKVIEANIDIEFEEKEITL